MFNTLLFVFIAFFTSDYSSSLSEAINSAKMHRMFKHGYWSIYAKNLETGEILGDVYSEKSLKPASNIKLVTTAAALDLLGENFTMNTGLYYSGTISAEGILNGQLVLRGMGDPTLGSATFPGVADLDSLGKIIIASIQRAGITEINGDIVGDDSYFDYMPLSPAWQWRDIGNYYAANTSGLCIHENMYRIYFRPARYVGGPAEIIRVEPELLNLTFINHMRTGPKGSGDRGFIYAAPWQYLHQLEGTIPAGRTEFSIKGALPDPAQFAADFLKHRLSKDGIDISGRTTTARLYNQPLNNLQFLFNITSPPLKDIIFWLNKKSINLYAEHLLKIIGREIGTSGDLETGLAVVLEWMNDKDINLDGTHLFDGSGLAYTNLTTTRFFVSLLEKMYTEDEFNSFYNSLPVAGLKSDPGTIRHMCQGSYAANNLRAKTGTLDGIRSHSGYVHNRSGQMIAFSMIANTQDASSRAVDRLHEKVMVQLSKLH